MNTSQNSTSQPHVLRWPLIYPQPQILDFNCHQVNILQSGMPQLIFKNLGVYLKDVAKKSTSVLKTLEPSPAETEQAASTLEEQARSPCGECPESEAVPVPELCQSVRSTGNTARLCKPGLSKFLAMPNWERKEHIRSLMIFKMLLTVLCQLLFSVSLTAIFRFGLEEWMHMFDGNASPLRWSPLLMYGTAAIAMGYFPLEILRKHWVDAALFILVSGAWGCSSVIVTCLFRWEMIMLHVCFILCIAIMLAIQLSLNVEDAFSFVGFGLAQSILVIIFGLVTFFISFIQIDIIDMLLVYLLTLLFHVYVILDIWLITRKDRFWTGTYYEPVLVVVALYTDIVVMPVRGIIQLYTHRKKVIKKIMSYCKEAHAKIWTNNDQETLLGHKTTMNKG